MGQGFRIQNLERWEEAGSIRALRRSGHHFWARTDVLSKQKSPDKVCFFRRKSA